jgi:hypothetical protein
MSFEQREVQDGQSTTPITSSISTRVVLGGTPPNSPSETGSQRSIHGRMSENVRSFSYSTVDVPMHTTKRKAPPLDQLRQTHFNGRENKVVSKKEITRLVTLGPDVVKWYFLSPKMVDDADLIFRVAVIEHRAVSRMMEHTHRNIVDYFESGVFAGFVDFESAFCGIRMRRMQCTLYADVLRKAGSSDPLLYTSREVYSIAKGIAAGLDHLHDNGIIHADLTPTNILLGRSLADDPKICDFGNSVLGEPGQNIRAYSVPTDKIVTRAPYRMPEVNIIGGIVCARLVDHWGFGMTVLFMCNAREIECGVDRNRIASSADICTYLRGVEMGVCQYSAWGGFSWLSDILHRDIFMRSKIDRVSNLFKQ